MPDGWIVIPNWERHQHRDAARAVVPTWIKLFTELGSKPEWLELTMHQRGVLVSLWIEYARAKRQVRDNVTTLSRQLSGNVRDRVTRATLDALSDAGFIEYSASRPASNPASRDASLEKKSSKDSSSLAPNRSEGDDSNSDESSSPPSPLERYRTFSEEEWRTTPSKRRTLDNSPYRCRVCRGPLETARLLQEHEAKQHDIGAEEWRERVEQEYKELTGEEA